MLIGSRQSKAMSRRIFPEPSEAGPLLCSRPPPPFCFARRAASSWCCRWWPFDLKGDDLMVKRRGALTRRKFLNVAGTGALAAVGSGVAPAIVRGQTKDPIIIGHQAELTGGLSSWGYWLDKGAGLPVGRVQREGRNFGRA